MILVCDSVSEGQPCSHSSLCFSLSSIHTPQRAGDGRGTRESHIAALGGDGLAKELFGALEPLAADAAGDAVELGAHDRVLAPVFFARRQYSLNLLGVGKGSAQVAQEVCAPRPLRVQEPV